MANGVAIGLFGGILLSLAILIWKELKRSRRDSLRSMVREYLGRGRQLCEQLHRSPPGFRFSNKIIGEVADGVKSIAGKHGKGRKGFQGKETAGFVPFGLRHRSGHNCGYGGVASRQKFQIFLARLFTAFVSTSGACFVISLSLTGPINDELPWLTYSKGTGPSPVTTVVRFVADLRLERHLDTFD